MNNSTYFYTMPYKIAIVDDSFQIIAALKEELTALGEVEVIMMGRNGEDFLLQLKKLAPEEYPQLVLMDIDMPIMNGIETVRNSSVLYESIKYIMLTVFDDDDKLFDAIQAGADGYLLKEEQPNVILRSIKEVMEQQGAPMSPRIARKTLDLLSQAKSKTQGITVSTTLSEREMDILKGLVDGLDYKQIAEKHFISPFTVRNHITKVYEKLHVTSKTDAVKLAIKNRWV
jgi:DNA-binding NarL/FixJ family response regulator